MAPEESGPFISPYGFIILGHERGQYLARLIGDLIHPVQNLSVLDLGCREGSISLAFSEVCHQVTAVDVIYDRTRQVSWKEKKNVANLSFGLANGLTLPFKDNTFDLVLINGVLEWVGLPGAPNDPRDLQKSFLQEVKRVLRKGGFFYLAIENRLFPGYIVKDSHTKMPLVGILPRKLANGLAQRFYQKPYRTFTYSYWELRQMIREAGFTSCSVFVPIYTYWFPYALNLISDRKGILRSLSSPDLKDASPQYKLEAMVTSKQRCFIKLITLLGLARVFCNAFVVIGWK